jgi:hypothetical protein
MRRSIALPLLALMTLLLFGCGQASNPPVGPGPAAKGAEDASEILKGINESIKASGPLPSGVSLNLTQAGPHQIKTIADVPISTAMQDERGIVSFGGRKLAVQFDIGQVILDENEKAKLPGGTKEVEIHFVGSKLTVKADGTVLSIPGSRPGK